MLRGTKNILLGLAGLPFLSRSNPKETTELSEDISSLMTLETVLRKQAGQKNILESSKGLPDGYWETGQPINPNYRPVAETLRSTITDRKKNGHLAFLPPSERPRISPSTLLTGAVAGLETTANIIRANIKEGQDKSLPAKLKIITHAASNFPREEFSEILTITLNQLEQEYLDGKNESFLYIYLADNNYGPLEPLINPLSGFGRRAYSDLNIDAKSLYTRKKIDQIITSNPNNLFSDTELHQISDLSGHIQQEFATIRNWVETQRQQQGHPLTSAQLLDHFQDINQDNLQASIWDMSDFFELVSRSNAGSNEPPFDKSLGSRWLAENFIDEYTPIGNTFTDCLKKDTYKDLCRDDNWSLVNRVGIAYHVWNSLAMLTVLPLEQVQNAAIYRQLIYLSVENHGSIKVASDIYAELQLVESDRYLQTLIKPKTNN
jgi:hypothetical protein